MYKILIIGFGSIGKRHFENISSNFHAQLIIFTKRKDLKKLEKQGVIVTNSLKVALLHKPDIAFVTNETSLHVKIATTLAKHGVHLFLEKPLSNSMSGVKKLKSIISTKKLISQMGCNFRFHPCIMKIKKILDKNDLGRVISVQVESNSYLPDWHPYENYRFGYAARDDLGGGIALTCIHELDFLYWFFGDVKEIFSITGKYSDLEVTSDDLSAMIMIFKNNIVGELHLDYFQRPDFKSCKIKGTKSTLYWNSTNNEIKLFSQKNKSWKSIYKLKNYDPNQMYVDELKYFFKCIKNNKKTINDIDDGIKTLKVVLSAKKSSESGNLITINKK
jgi:predicted dehydrogenase